MAVIEISSDDSSDSPPPLNRKRRRRAALQNTPLYARRSHHVATLCGISSREYRKLKRWGIPDSVLMSLCFLQFAFGWASMELDNVEWFAGVGMVQQAFEEASFQAFAYEIENDPYNMNFISVAGFIYALQLLRASKWRSFHNWGILCSSWIWISKAVTHRTHINPRGLDHRQFVSQGNQMGARMALCCLVLLAKKCIILVEQPLSSLLAFCQPWKMLNRAVMDIHRDQPDNLAATGMVSLTTWMGAFGAPTCKATNLYCSCVDVLLPLHRTMTKAQKDATSGEATTTERVVVVKGRMIKKITGRKKRRLNKHRRTRALSVTLS